MKYVILSKSSCLLLVRSICRFPLGCHLVFLVDWLAGDLLPAGLHQGLDGGADRQVQVAEHVDTHQLRNTKRRKVNKGVLCVLIDIISFFYWNVLKYATITKRHFVIFTHFYSSKKFGQSWLILNQTKPNQPTFRNMRLWFRYQYSRSNHGTDLYNSKQRMDKKVVFLWSALLIT